MILASLMYGSFGLLSRALEDYGIFFQNYVRSFAIVGILFVIGLATKQLKPFARKDFKWLAITCFFSCFSIAPIVYAFRYLPLGTTSFLFYGSLTACSYLIGIIFLKEKLTKTKAIILLLSLIGMLLIFSFDFKLSLILAALMAILNGVGSGGEAAFSKKLSGNYSSLQLVLVIFLAIALTHLPLSFLTGEAQDLSMFTNQGIAVLLYTLFSLVAFYFVIEGYKYLDAGVAAIVGLSEIIFGVVFGIIFFSEQLTTNTILGGTLIIIAAALPHIGVLKRKSVS